MFEDGRELVHRFSPDRPKLAQLGEPTGRDRAGVHVHGSKGSLSEYEAFFHSGKRDPMSSPIVRHEEAGDLQALSMSTPDGDLRWTNPFFGHALNDEQIAVATLLRAMTDAVQFSGVSPYPAWAALEDVELINALGYSADRGGRKVALPAAPVLQKVLKRLRL